MESNNNKLVVFDFCETLVSFQTADAFVDFIIAKEAYHKFKWINTLKGILVKLRILAILSKLFPDLNPSKRLKLFQIRGINSNKLLKYAQDFSKEMLTPNLIDVLYKRMLSHQSQNDIVIIISGGYSPYIKVFAEQHGIKYFFATEIELSKNKVTGHFSGKDCLNQQKVELLEQFLQDNPIQFSSSIAYSDSSSDLPLLKWVNEGYVVSKDSSQKWAFENKLKEIIYN